MDADMAITVFTRAIESRRLSQSDLARSYYNRGIAYFAKGYPDRAVADLTEAIRLDPNDANSFINRGNAYISKGDNDRAIADYNEAIRLGPEHPKFSSVFYNRGFAYRANGDSDRAIADYSEAIRLDPQYAVGLHQPRHRVRLQGRPRPRHR